MGSLGWPIDVLRHSALHSLWRRATNSIGDPHAPRGHDRYILPAAPVVHGGELDVGQPSSAVIAQPLRMLNSGPRGLDPAGGVLRDPDAGQPVSGRIFSSR